MVLGVFMQTSRSFERHSHSIAPAARKLAGINGLIRYMFVYCTRLLMVVNIRLDENL